MKSKQKALSIFLLMVMMVLFTGTLSYAGNIPQLINYNGSLTDTNGNPVPDGQYAVVFNIYDVATAGTPLWTETWNGTTSPVIASKGSFNAMLGTYSPIPASFFSDHPVAYLGVKVGNDSEMLPRQRVTSVGYAFTAGNGIPKGGIIMWSGTEANIPAGWGLCDGSNNTPDLRSRFIVGRGQGAGLTLYDDNNKTGGEERHVLTMNEMPSHTHLQDPHSHGITDSGHNHTFPVSGVSGTTRASKAGPDTAGTATTSGSTTGITINSIAATNQNTGGGQAHNNLPPYYALAFIMKL